MRQSVLHKRRKRAWSVLGDNMNMMQGTLHERYLPCGKEGCKCKKGEKHGPFYYLVYQEDGRQRTQYIPRRKLKEVKEAVKAYKKVKGILAEVAEINRKLLRAEGK